MDEAGKIVAALTRVLGEFGILGVEPILEHPADLTHGDYATNIAFAVAKKAKKSPKKLADEIVGKLGSIDGVEKVEVAGPGFINFYLSRNYFSNSIADIVAVGKDWGKGGTLKSKKVIVEYSQPNPFKPFHIGHLMSTTVGESISRLVEFSGANLRRMNYQGDIGLHVAKCLWGVMKKGSDVHDVVALGDAYVIGSAAYEDDPKAKAEIDDINKRLYQDDEVLKPLYEAGRRASLAHFDEIYKILGTRFDDSILESEVWKEGMKVVEDGLAKGIFEESEGAVVYKGEKAGLHTRVFITSQKTPTYEAKELGLIQEKSRRFPFDLNVTTIADEQDNYFKVVEAALAEIWPEKAGTYTHVAFGMLLLTTGKMSSRKGNVITGESLINDMRSEAFEKMTDRDLGDKKDAIADSVAVAAIKYSILKQGTGQNIVFDPEASLSFEGDSGPYLQYSHTRALSVLEKAKKEKIQPSAAMAPENVTDLERVLYRFPEVVARATREYEPHYVTTYLTELAGMFNSWYAKEKIVDARDPHSSYKVALTLAFTTTMKNGLWLLGITAPQKM